MTTYQKTNAARYEHLREKRIYEMTEAGTLPSGVAIEDMEDWFDAQVDADIRKTWPNATIGGDA